MQTLSLTANVSRTKNRAKRQAAASQQNLDGILYKHLNGSEKAKESWNQLCILCAKTSVCKAQWKLQGFQTWFTIWSRSVLELEDLEKIFLHDMDHFISR